MDFITYNGLYHLNYLKMAAKETCRLRLHLFVLIIILLVRHGNGAYICDTRRAGIANNDWERYISTKDNTTTLTCQLPYYDYPDSYIRWKKNGAELIKGTGTLQGSEANYTAKRGTYSGHYILEITGLKLNAAGQYNCDCFAIYDTRGRTGNTQPSWDNVNGQDFKVFVSDPLSTNFVNRLLVNKKRRKLGVTLDFYPGDSVSISTSVSGKSYPGPNRRVTWYWMDTWLAQLTEVLSDQSPTNAYSYSTVNYSFQFSAEVTITSTCRDYNVGDHKLQLGDESSISQYNLPFTNFNILTISCKAAPSVFSPTDITALVAGVVHIIAIVLIVVNSQKHKGQVKGRPFPGLVFLVLVMELIMVFSLIFVPVLQSVGQIGKAEIAVRSYAGAILMAIASIIVAGVAIGLESYILNTVHAEDTPADS